jgi:hypothetical protein
VLQPLFQAQIICPAKLLRSSSPSLANICCFAYVLVATGPAGSLNDIHSCTNERLPLQNKAACSPARHISSQRLHRIACSLDPWQHSLQDMSDDSTSFVQIICCWNTAWGTMLNSCVGATFRLSLFHRIHCF